MKSLLALMAGITLTGAIGPEMEAPAPAGPVGTWVNPRSTVKIRLGPCGGELCGWVVWAADEAEQDAREAGVSPLVGLQLLRSYRATSATTWEGRVFVPDWNRTFFSRMVLLGPRSVKISGCVLGGMICKSQTWTRA